MAASPSSKTLVRGVQNTPLVGFSFRATADTVKLSSIKIYATSSSGTLTSGEIQNLGLYDGDTRLGDLEGLSASDLTFTVDNFQKVIQKDQTVSLTVKGNISSDATNNDIYRVYINALGDITSSDSQGNSVTATGVTANSGGAVSMTIGNVGDVVVQALDTADDAGIILAGREETLANFRWTATNEDMNVKDFDVLINTTSVATATTTVTGDDVPYIRLYDGSTLLSAGGSNCVVNSISYSGCWPVPISGASSSVVLVRNLNWNIPTGANKTLTVKGLVDGIRFNAEGADHGASIFAHIQATGFKASGQTADDNTITAASGQQKVIYKTKPVLSKLSDSTLKLQGGTAIPVFKFRIAADASGDLEWRKIQFRVSMTGATMSAVTTSNVQIDNVSDGNNNLSLATVYNGAEVASNTTVSITGGNSGYVTLQLTTPQRITAGNSKDYLLKLSFTDLVTSPGAIISTRLNRTESTLVNGLMYGSITGETATSGIPSFIWSDFSSSSHATSTNDWANGRYVKTFDDVFSITN